MRNYQIYRASQVLRSKQLGSVLSKELRQKYGKRTLRVIKGDTVRVMRGEFRGVDGKVSNVSTDKNSIAIEGIKKEKVKGDKFDVYIHTSNVMITDLNLDDHWRKSKLEGKQPKITPKEKPEPKPEPQEEKPKEVMPQEKIEEKPKKKETKKPEKATQKKVRKKVGTRPKKKPVEKQKEKVEKQ